MRKLLVCQRDPECSWSCIAAAGDERALAAQAKHHARHDSIDTFRREAAAARALAHSITSATPEGDAHKNKDVRGVGDRGSRSPSPASSVLYVCGCGYEVVLPQSRVGERVVPPAHYCHKKAAA